MRSKDPGPGRVARAVFRSCTIPGADAPHDRASLKIYYPAIPDDGDEQRNAGLVPADNAGAPYPVMIMMPGINVGPESYGWLAVTLAVRGMIVVTYSMIAEEMPGYISLTPGLDLSAITPETWGTRPSATALGAIINALVNENESGVLGGCIDTGNIIVAGHSAGGSVAMYNARSDWFPGLKGAAAYAAHAAPATMLGFEKDSVLDLANDVPVMLVGGENDGVVAASAHRYGGEHRDRIAQTFDDGLSGDGCLVMLKGANHFSLAYPVDESTGRHFLDGEEESDGGAIRALLTDLLSGFVFDCCRGGTRVDECASHELISTFRRR